MGPLDRSATYSLVVDGEVLERGLRASESGMLLLDLPAGVSYQLRREAGTVSVAEPPPVPPRPEPRRLRWWERLLAAIIRLLGK